MGEIKRWYIALAHFSIGSAAWTLGPACKLSLTYMTISAASFIQHGTWEISYTKKCLPHSAFGQRGHPDVLYDGKDVQIVVRDVTGPCVRLSRLQV